MPNPGPAANAGRQAAIVEALQVAVPAWIDALGNASTAARVLAKDEAERVMAAADLGQLDPHGTQSWDTDQAFDALAKSLALDAYRPGGVTYLGLHWEVVPASANLGAAATVTTEGGML